MGKSVSPSNISVEKIGGLPPGLGEFPVLLEKAAKGLRSVINTWNIVGPSAEQEAGRLVLALQASDGSQTLLLAGLLEKISRATMNMVKAVDEATRLLSFISGGPDSRPDLGDMSDSELCEILVNVAVERGLWKRIKERVDAVPVPSYLPGDLSGK